MMWTVAPSNINIAIEWMPKGWDEVAHQALLDRWLDGGQIIR